MENLQFRAWIKAEKRMVDVDEIYFGYIKRIGIPFKDRTEKSFYKNIYIFSEIVLMQSTNGKNWYICDDNLIVIGTKFEEALCPTSEKK